MAIYKRRKTYILLPTVKTYGALDGGCQFHMSILRNGNVALSILKSGNVALSNLRNDHVPCHYLFKIHVAFH